MPKEDELEKRKRVIDFSKLKDGWVFTREMRPSAPFNKIVAHDITLDITMVLELDEETGCYVDPDDWSIFLGSIDLWMPILLP